MSRNRFFFLFALTICFFCSPEHIATCRAEEGPALAPEYHTPIAGEPFHTVFLGRNIDIPAMDRSKVTALTLGGALYLPKQGNNLGTPMFALYLSRIRDDFRTRDVISIFENDLELNLPISGPLELAGRFENYTLPGGQKEVLDNKVINWTSVEWGTLTAAIGPGLRFPVSPFQVDNDLNIQLLATAGYFYANRTKETGEELPPHTALYGLKLRVRYDGMLRNILELPHEGLAAGLDFDFTHRDRWHDFGRRGIMFKKDDTRDYTQFSGYLMWVGGIPGLSEKNRVLASLHGGVTPFKEADRYNAIRIGGGPLPSESGDLYRPDYPGTMFNEVLVKDYALAALEYRRELAFFIYLHVRGSFIWAVRPSLVGSDSLSFGERNGAAGTVGIDSGFFWNSELYLDYSYDSGFIRNGRPGSGIIILWNKSL